MRIWFSGPRIFGIRPGISLGREDFRARPGRPASGGFVYVVTREGDHRIKIGSSVHPPSRLASLQTGSADRLSIAYSIQVPARMVEIEREAHRTLDRYRGLGEWFEVPVEVAVAAISAAAYRFNISAAKPKPMRRKAWTAPIVAWILSTPALMYYFPQAMPGIVFGSAIGCGIFSFALKRTR